MARHEISGNPELNAFKDIPISAYIKLPSESASADIKLPITNGKKTKIMIIELKNKNFFWVTGVKNLNIEKEEDKKRMKNSTLSGRGDEITAEENLLSINSKVITVRAKLATRSAASFKTPANNSKIITGKTHETHTATEFTVSSKDTGTPTID